jgi:hypothetical protein
LSVVVQVVTVDTVHGFGVTVAVAAASLISQVFHSRLAQNQSRLVAVGQVLPEMHLTSTQENTQPMAVSQDIGTTHLTQLSALNLVASADQPSLTA